MLGKVACCVVTRLAFAFGTEAKDIFQIHSKVLTFAISGMDSRTTLTTGKSVSEIALLII
jgi:hypothetical protein